MNLLFSEIVLIVLLMWLHQRLCVFAVFTFAHPMLLYNVNQVRTIPR